MQMRMLGKSDVELPVVSFGAWAIGGWMWGGTDDDDAVRAIHCALDEGVTCIDTAPMYGMGHSESVVGKALRGRRDKAVVATKCGLRWDLAEGESFFDTKDAEGRPHKVYRNLRTASIKHECDLSLQRLGVDVIDLYQCHWPDTTTPIDETMEALLSLQAAGKVRAIGVSNFTPDMMEQCLAKGVIASDQPKYNALERGIEQDVLPFCLKHDIGVLAYSPIAQGLLTGKVSVDRTFNDGDLRQNHPMFSKEARQKVLDMLAEVQPIADGHGVTLGQLFIAWTVAQPGLTSALVGARTEAQVKENAAAGRLVLSETEAADIRNAVESAFPLA